MDDDINTHTELVREAFRRRQEVFVREDATFDAGEATWSFDTWRVTGNRLWFHHPTDVPNFIKSDPDLNKIFTAHQGCWCDLPSGDVVIGIKGGKRRVLDKSKRSPMWAMFAPVLEGIFDSYPDFLFPSSVVQFARTLVGLNPLTGKLTLSIIKGGKK
jgi:hypothetical protein